MTTIGLTTKWLQILSLPLNHLVTNPIELPLAFYLPESTIKTYLYVTLPDSKISQASPTK